MGWWWRSIGGRPSLWRRTAVATYYTIQAVPREYTGRRLAARERSMGRIPAVVFRRDSTGEEQVGQNGPCPVSRKLLLTTSEKQIRSLIKRVPSFCSTTFALKVRAGCGSSVVLHSGTVLPVKVHRDETTGGILNLVLEWAEKGSTVKVDVPVVYKGEDVCPGLLKGGYLHKMRSSLRYLCPAENIPPTIEVDLKNLDIGEKVFFRDLPVDPSLKCLNKDEKVPICKLVVARPKEEEPTAKVPEPTEVQEPL